MKVHRGNRTGGKCCALQFVSGRRRGLSLVLHLFDGRLNFVSVSQKLPRFHRFEVFVQLEQHGHPRR